MSDFPTALPAPRTPDSMQAPPLRWGVMGPGWIAERFIGSLQRHTRQQVLAVGSRDLSRSTAFAAKNGVDRAYGSYQELLADPEVDVVYIATPHNAHYPCALMSLMAGKHTLVEKPMALNAGQATRLAEIAADKVVFFMEALWTQFLPKFDVIRQLLDSGALGRIHTVIADHGEFFKDDHRIMRHDLAGGPLLDLGTYPVAFAQWVLGNPVRVLATGQPHPAGVNGRASAILVNTDGNEALVHCTIFSGTPTTGVIAGTAATLTIPGPYYQPGNMELTSVDGEVLSWTEPAVSHDALHFEAAEVARRISAGETGSPLRPIADSIATMAIIDEIRAQIGIVFDEER
ncbi:MAG: Gfo/Idh/MocA family oxidoreductase [Nakamurella sp.]